MQILNKIYDKLLKHFGAQHWWPGDGAFEVMIGAILTQNTNWTNVEKAINNLKTANVLSPEELNNMDTEKLAQIIKPAGYYNIKAKRLKNFIKWLMDSYDGDLNRMAKASISTLREGLLSINGIGPETADSILLYAAKKLSFVVDAYTYRVFSRHNLIPEESTYDEIKSFFEDNLPARLDWSGGPDDVELFNEYHALIVRVGKEYCKKTKPLCEKCPLEEYLPS